MGIGIVSVVASNTTRVLLILILVSLPLTWLTLAIDTRYAVLIPVTAMWLLAPPQLRVRGTLLVPGFLALVTFVAALSMSWSDSLTKAQLGTLSLAMLAATSLVVATRCTFKQVSWAVYVWTLVLLVTGLVLFAVGISEAMGGPRVRGLMGNAQGAGIIALICIGVAPMLGRRAFIVAWPLAIFTIILAQSRAAALGCVVLIAVLIGYWIKKKTGVVGLLAFSLLTSLPLLWLGLSLELTGETGLIRFNNSRTVVWEPLLTAFITHPWAGVGWASYESGVESSYLKVLAELGIIGFFIVSAAAIILVKQFSRLQVTGLALALGILVNAVFEGWLLTGGSAYAWAVWLLAASTGSRPPLLTTTPRQYSLPLSRHIKLPLHLSQRTRN